MRSYAGRESSINTFIVPACLFGQAGFCLRIYLEKQIVLPPC